MRLLPSRFEASNYKSLARVSLPLKGLTILVGRNGAGKSNIVDALRFISDALRVNLDHALRERGGVEEVRRRASRRPPNFRLAIDLESSDKKLVAHYEFVVGPVSGGGYEVVREEARVEVREEAKAHYYTLDKGEVVNASRPFSAKPSSKDLFLRSITAEPGFDELYAALTDIATYNPNPATIRELQDPDALPLLRRDGRNLPSVWHQLPEDRRERVEAYLKTLVPGFTRVERKTLGPKETLGFKQRWDNKNDWWFYAYSISDGTLRLTALLVAIFQPTPSMVAVEEPEVALHPAAARGFADALLEAATEKPILVTTHSTDILENQNISPEQVFVVHMHQGKTQLISPGFWVKELVEKHLYTLGELHRLDQLAEYPMEIEQ